METDALIIGGGITGLSAAHYLKKSGTNNFLLLEEDPHTGGKVSTIRENNFIIDEGPDSLISTKPSAYELIKELGLEDEIIYPASKGFYIYHNKNLIKTPDGLAGFVPSQLGPFFKTPLFSFSGKLRILSEFFIPSRNQGDTETLAEFIRRRFGNEMLERYAGPLLSGIYASAPEKLSLKSTFPQFKAMEDKYGSITRAMLINRRNASPGQDKPMFYSLKSGMGILPETLAGTLKEHIKTSTRITAIEETSDGKYRVFSEKGETIETKKLIVTAPAHNVFKLFSDQDSEICETLKRIPYVSTAVMSMAFKKSDVKNLLEGTGFLIPRTENTYISSCTWTSSKWAGRCPDDHVLIRVFFGRLGSEEILECNDKKLYDLARTDMEGILGIKNHAQQYWIHRWHKAMPQYFPDHPEKLRKIDRFMQEKPGLYLTGAAYRGLGIPDCIRQGKETAEKVKNSLE